MKKVWEKPVLLVLARLRPEENVLTTCKIASTGNDINSAADACSKTVGGAACNACAPSGTT